MAMNASAYKMVALAKMPYKTLTNLSEDPNYVELPKLRREVYRNCAAVHSSCNGNNWHLELAMPVAHCAARNGGVAYTATPNHPGTYDMTIAANVGRVMQSRHEAEHKQRVDDHMIEQAVKNIIKIMLAEALPHWLLAEIEDRETGLNTISIHDIFDHAFDRRGQIQDDLVDVYTTIFNSPIDMSKGVNAYIELQEEYCEFFTNVQQPIMDTQLAAKGQLHAGQTG
eukprot:10902228-Ditylum_brightwellii.AAC.1